MSAMTCCRFGGALRFEGLKQFVTIDGVPRVSDRSVPGEKLGCGDSDWIDSRGGGQMVVGAGLWWVVEEADDMRQSCVVLREVRGQLPAVGDRVALKICAVEVLGGKMPVAHPACVTEDGVAAPC